MILETALNLLGTLPGQPAWNDDIAALYGLHLADWHPETRRRTVLEATATFKFRPSIGELRALALQLVMPMPSLAALREDLRLLILFHPPAQRSRHAPALLAALADELGGWREIGMLSSEELDRRFPAAYQRTKDEWVQQHAPRLLAEVPQPRALPSFRETRRIVEAR